MHVVSCLDDHCISSFRHSSSLGCRDYCWITQANKIIEDEAVAISEWKSKTTQLEADFFNVRRERDELKKQNDELIEYAKKKDAALALVMKSLQETDVARDKAEKLKEQFEKELDSQNLRA